MELSWIFPFTLIPGTAMLVLSTANRFHHVNSVIRAHMAAHGEDETVKFYMRRTRKLYIALVGLYCGVAFFAISALLANISTHYAPESWVDSAWTILQTCGVLCVFFSAVQLTLEALMAYEGIKREVADEHAHRLAERPPKSSSGTG